MKMRGSLSAKNTDCKEELNVTDMNGEKSMQNSPGMLRHH